MSLKAKAISAKHLAIEFILRYHESAHSTNKTLLFKILFNRVSLTKLGLSHQHIKLRVRSGQVADNFPFYLSVKISDFSRREAVFCRKCVGCK